ncbi:MAG: HAD-IA family hydrolase, partial [Planctomycetes bacterium]|nr:HAD-IA family hydrolase [Planctomycetota bacterium]
MNPVSEPQRIGLTYRERGFAEHFEIDLPQEQALLELHRRCSEEAGWGHIEGWADGISKFYTRWAELLLTALGAPSEAVRLHAAGFAEEFRDLSDSTRIVYDDTIETLEKLRRMSLRLAIVSNNDGSLARRVGYLGITHFFDTVVDSAVVESNKPDAGIFQHAMNAVDVVAAEVLHVGDSYEADVGFVGIAHVQHLGGYD